MSFSSAGQSSSFAKDYELNPAPTDSISDLSFSPVNDLLAVSSWDNQTRIYDVQLNTFNSSINAQPKTSVTHDQPVLTCAWSGDGSKLFSAGCDKLIKALDLGSMQQLQLVGHEAPIKSIKWSATLGMLLSTGWDKTLKYWDLRSPSPVASVQLPERAYSMDVSQQVAVVGCAERHLAFINLSNPTVISKTALTSLKWQTRVVSCYPNGEGYAVGSIEGRVSLNNFDESKKVGEFAFKCQREDSVVYPVNCISFHPVHGTFSTAGSDGTFGIWDKESKQRLKMSQKMNGPISSTAFNRTGSMFAYAVSYDWCKGYEHNKRDLPISVFVNATKENEVKPRLSSSSSLSYRRR